MDKTIKKSNLFSDSQIKPVLAGTNTTHTDKSVHLHGGVSYSALI